MFYRRYGSGGIDDVANEKRGKSGFAIIDDGEFYSIVGSHGGLFGVVYEGIIVVDYFAGGSRSLMAAKSLRCFDAMFTVLSDSVEPNSTLSGMMY